MTHAQEPDFVFHRNGRVHLNRWGCQFSRLLAAEVCESAWVMLDRPRSEVAWEYWLPTPFASFLFTSPPVRHRVPPGSEWALTQVCGAVHFSQSASTLMSGDTGLILNFWQRVLRQRAGCKNMCDGGTSSDSTTIQEAVFYNFDLTYHPCCLHPSLWYSLWWRRITRRPCTVFRLQFRWEIKDLVLICGNIPSHIWRNWNERKGSVYKCRTETYGIQKWLQK